MLSNVISLISLNGPMTCTGVAQLLNVESTILSIEGNHDY